MNLLLAILAAWTVVKVSDGDTIWVEPISDLRIADCTIANKERVKVRLNKIDAPESDQPWGKEATAALKALVDGREVELKGEEVDRFGRRLAVVMVDGEDLNLRLVKEGHAWHWRFDKDAAYRAAEEEARAARRGLWRDEAPVEPFLWRKQGKGRGKK